MNTSRRLGLAIAVMALAGLAVGAALQGQQPAAPATPAVLGQDGGPAWLDSQEIGSGVEMDTVIDFCENVTVPGTGATVRPISVHIDFSYGVGVLSRIDYLELHPLADTTPLSFSMNGMDRNIVVAQRPPFTPLNFLVTLAPKSGFTWGTIRGAVDVNIVATPQ